jgi:hypothetical protein
LVVASLLEKLGRVDALKALIVLAAFLAPIAIAARVSEEPVLESSRALAVVLGAAWMTAAFVGYGFYGWKRCIKAATLLVLAALVAFVAYARPWVGEEAEENVMFWYAASFSYENSADNLPIENVIISFPCPNIDNEPAQVVGLSWSLWWKPDSENENMIILQIQDGRVDNLLGDRTTTLLVQYGLENTQYGPKIGFSADRLFAREILLIQAYALIPLEKSNSITLRENKEDPTATGGHQYFPRDKKISFSYWSKLSQKVDNILEGIEEFSRIDDDPGENVFAWWILYPIS